MILVIDSDRVMGKCVLRTLKKNGFEGIFFDNAILAMEFVSKNVPDVIFMDVMLSGPDGFTFLNEMMSYEDTMKVPLIIYSEKDFSKVELKDYGVVGFLNKTTMYPEEIVDYAKKYAK